MGKKLVVLLCLGWISANTLAKNIELIAYDKHTVLVRTAAVYHRLSVQQTASGSIVVDTLYYFQPPRSNADYSDFLGNHQGAGDTCINRFTLLAPGKITKLMMQNMSGGTANWFLWAPAVKDNRYQFPNESGMVQLLAQPADWPCLKLNMAQQTMDSLLWNTYDLAVENSIVELDSSQLDFWVGYRLDNNGDPKIYQDGVYHYQWSEGSCRSFTTINNSGDWFGIFQPGTDNWVAHMMQVEVVYEKIPPIISKLPDLCDTFAASRTIWAEVVEIEGDNFEVNLTSKIGLNGQPEIQEMNFDTLNYFWANLEYNPGDTVYYYVRAEDSTGMAQCSQWKSFVCVPPPLETHILLIDNSGIQTGDRYIDALNRLGLDFFYWNLDEHKGIDTTVIFYPDFLTLLVLDGDDMILPVTDIEHQDIYNIAGFLNSGGNLLLVDMDYFYRWDLIGEGNFESGDFAYDFLGIEDYESDPDDDYNPDNGGIADTLLLSVAKNPVTSAFSVDSLAYGPLRYQIGDSVILNWADFIEPSNDGRQVFRGKISKRGLAVCLESKYYRTATFCVPIELAESTAEFYSLLDSTLAWLNENTTRLDTTFSDIERQQPVALNSSFHLLGNYPNPFNPVTTISFELMERDKVTVRIFNLLGEQVAEILNAELKPGIYFYNWTAKSGNGRLLPSGIYIYRLEVGSQSAAGKMILLR
ncbi:MAG TPA: T9SS type A sorting domain-containing protein [Candidatus Marinimicrobia bacterium]|nr:T9SS type A sorting domain-containing protein [Candidatus Neomarinimicrobiota bacterium]